MFIATSNSAVTRVLNAYAPLPQRPGAMTTSRRRGVGAFWSNSRPTITDSVAPKGRDRRLHDASIRYARDLFWAIGRRAAADICAAPDVGRERVEYLRCRFRRRQRSGPISLQQRLLRLRLRSDRRRDGFRGAFAENDNAAPLALRIPFDAAAGAMARMIRFDAALSRHDASGCQRRCFGYSPSCRPGCRLDARHRHASSYAISIHAQFSRGR